MNNLKVFLLSFALLFVFGMVFAQEKAPTETPAGVGGGYSPVPSAEEAVALDEDIQPEDLEVSEPRILPDNPFYFLKNWARGIQMFFAFEPVKKAELRLKFANEKLIEAKKIVEKTKDPEKIKKATENYQQEIERIKERVEKIKEKAKENPGVESFLDKFIHQQTLHQKLLQRLETQVPAEVFEKIKEARERHLERFQEVMLKLEDRKEKITEKLDEILEKQRGSQFKNFKNLEVLKNLEEKVPEEAKEAIKKAQENALKRLQGNLEKMSSEDQERFKEYLEKISGDKEKQMEILENLREELKENPELRERLLETRERILERIRERIQERDCPKIQPPAPEFCQEGRIVPKRDEKGCLISFECVIPAEIELPERPEKPAACITLWDPVCGKDGKTYSNSCFAKLAGIEVAYKGECRAKECQTDNDCPQLRCGPAGVRCIGVKAKCIEGKCQVVSIETPSLGACKDLCGDGICQEIVCMAIGCPCAETKETCPEDCK